MHLTHVGQKRTCCHADADSGNSGRKSPECQAAPGPERGRARRVAPSNARTCDWKTPTDLAPMP
eukprot:15338066-Alexandrium_andersonii.AAC.1